MKHIYIIRHGQTDYNKRGIVQGSSVDTSLNETGREQADRFYEAYKDVPFDKIYTSKLQRTHQSVQKFIDKNIPWEQHIGLNEISWGEFDGKLSSKEDKEHYLSIMQRWTNGETNLAIGGGESPELVQLRQAPVWDLILSRAEEKNVLVCIHGRALRILMCHIHHLSLTKMDSFEHDNLCLYLLEYDGKKTELLKTNCLLHLKEFKDN
ncbi:MAG: histidine phosphatase family protein [Opitutaceae bacterium]|nr:histidine phosphatase family protein [Cytophagales bacterium]